MQRLSFSFLSACFFVGYIPLTRNRFVYRIDLYLSYIYTHCVLRHKTFQPRCIYSCLISIPLISIDICAAIDIDAACNVR